MSQETLFTINSGTCEYNYTVPAKNTTLVIDKDGNTISRRDLIGKYLDYSDAQKRTIISEGNCDIVFIDKVYTKN